MHRTKTRTRSWGAIIGVSAIAAVLVLPVATAAPDYTPVQPAANDSSQLPAVGTVTRQFTRMQAGQSRVAVVSGVLTAPSALQVESVGDAYLASNPTVLGGANPANMVLDKVIDFPRGQALRYKQTFRGLPVYGGGTVVRLDAERRVRWAGSDARPIPEDLSIEPTLTARQAVAEAARLAGYDQAYVDAIDLSRTVQLAVYSQPNMTHPRLAYWIQLETDWSRLAVYRAFVDAHTGHVYRLENRVMHGALPNCAPGTKRAYVYPENPLRTPDLECVSLEPYLAANEDQLLNPDIDTGNCIDNLNCRTVQLIFSFDVHWCDDGPVAATNGGGDFLDHQPPVDEIDPEDTFSEVQMFYHLNKAFDEARALGGFNDLNARPLGAVVNFRPPFDLADPLGTILNQMCTGPTYNGGMELLPFDNAAFIPAGGLLGYPDSDGLVFGQGTMVDFAYDGDVVYHEFGHALMNTVAPNLPFGVFDQYGYDPTAGGMHEGYADLMSMWVTGDSQTGEWSLGSLGPQYVRDMDNNDYCPSHLVGQVHEDALPITGGIWAGREAIAANGGDRRAFDEATFAAQQLFTAMDNYESASAKTIAEVDAMMGATHAATLSQILADRGLSDCNNRVADGTQTKELMIVGDIQGAAAGIFPGVIQWEYDLPGGADSITVAAGLLGGAGGLLGGAPMLSVGLKAGGPILWANDGMGSTGDYTTQVPMPVDTANPGPASVTINGPFAPGTYYLQMFVEGGYAVMRDVSITHMGGDPVPDPDAGPDTPDAGPDTTDGGNGVDNRDPGTCGCVVDARGQSPAGALLLGFFAMLGMVWLRRRR